MNKIIIITAEYLGETLYIGTAKQVEEFIMVETKDYKGGIIMKRYNLCNSHEITIEKGERGIKDDYKVTFFEDGKALFSPEYYSKDALEYEFDIVL